MLMAYIRDLKHATRSEDMRPARLRLLGLKKITNKYQLSFMFQ